MINQVAYRKGGILCFEMTELSKTFLLFKFDKNWPNIEHTMVFCTTLGSERGDSIFLSRYVKRVTFSGKGR